MKKKLTYLIILALSIVVFHSNAQQVNTMYFMDNMPYRNTLNPAFQPYSNFYLGFPVIGLTKVGVGLNSLSPTDILNPDGTVKNFYDVLKKYPYTALNGNFNINLLSFGFRTGKSYWNFSLAERADLQFGMSKELMNGLLNSVPLNSNVTNFGLDFTLFTEAGLGYSRKVNDRLNVGLKLKFLYGTANLSLDNTNLSANYTNNILNLTGNGYIKESSAFKINTTSVPAIPPLTDFIKPSGVGVSGDLGISYKILDNLNVSAALLDLGMINWNNNAKYKKYTLKFNDFKTSKIDSLLNHSSDFYSLDSVGNSYTTYTTPRINVGAEYGLFSNKLTVGLLSETALYKSYLYEELTASLNYKPIDWFNLSASYSVLNGRMSNIGAGLGLRTGFLHWFIAADYIPLNIGTVTFPATPPAAAMSPIPAPNTPGVNIAFGINFVFGNRKDADHDGVVDRKDKCPETPFSVVVDKKGCPLDTDGDGVPDYIDKCAKTPPEAYSRINQEGCPLDFDGDGVPDYLDKCPDTPAEAIGFTDKFGCSLDTDSDGVFDYKDKCPGTPIGVKVDSLGCPLDTDGDGVADYKDKCPGTPMEARNLVDSLGCPLDTDKDGVFDYLDLCPNTPAEARAFVDKNGCTLDKDGDGVPDYLDKCPNTPIEARGTVDENGCPRDTDGDGVLDYMDNCPKIPGVASNKGCPEIKKEVKALFKKALQGIQFETGKYIIKPVSFKILDQVAKVLVENPTYLVEVQGHTDNVGKPEANMTLSDNRANAVKLYLINKGVAAGRMTSHGYGDTVPVATNKTKAGKALNRRVEFVVTFEEIVTQ